MSLSFYELREDNVTNSVWVGWWRLYWEGYDWMVSQKRNRNFTGSEGCMEWTFQAERTAGKEALYQHAFKLYLLSTPRTLSVPLICQIIMFCLMTPLLLLPWNIYLLCYLIFHVFSLQLEFKLEGRRPSFIDYHISHSILHMVIYRVIYLMSTFGLT